MYRDLKIGDIVRHFKYETLSIEDKKLNKYLYCIKDFAEHTETKESMVVYQALYSPLRYMLDLLKCSLARLILINTQI